MTYIRKLKKLLFYAGIEREEYRALLPSIREENRVLLRVFSLLASGMFFVLYFASLFSGDFAAMNSSTYLFFGADMVISVLHRSRIPTGSVRKSIPSTTRFSPNAP